ncbi:MULTISPECIES: substrate-binding domain-containing protein [Rhodococcus]|uniref:Probable transcriptional regulator n=1 Tax=Rhodococcus jostii (strain RHA1) TaxID=101510 RepID=Q0RWH5_RHOJR|nr:MULTISPECIES: substrate-binding domain-containing protein [Rhodococcus]ABH00361.1 probable transcriptional regulator [Rhodococcus jostii RHA1]
MIYAPERTRSSDWTIAMVVPLQGPAGLFGPSCEAMSELVARDLNDAGGILGREVRMEVVDGGGDPARVAAEVGALVDQGRIDAVTGWHISSVRHTLAPVLAGRVPYVYPALYEGGEHRPGVYCSGETPRLQIEPALRWMREHMGMRRWYVVGDDYVWPRRSAAAVHAFADEIGLDIVGQSFVSLGGRNIGRVVRHIAETECDGVCMLLVGQDAVAFNRSFARAGLQDRLIRFTPLMDENMMIASGPGALVGMFAAASYFRSKVDTNSMALLGRYVDLHGPDGPPITAVSESCYEGGQTLAHLIGRAGSPSVAAIDAALDGTAYEGPRGTVEFKGRRAHQPVHLAVANGLDFDILTTL